MHKLIFDKEISKKIKTLRKLYSMTLDEFIKLSGLNCKKSNLSAIENGNQPISLFQLSVICKNLKIPIAEFISEKEPEKHNCNCKYCDRKYDIKMCDCKESKDPAGCHLCS